MQGLLQNLYKRLQSPCFFSQIPTLIGEIALLYSFFAAASGAFAAAAKVDGVDGKIIG